MRRKELIATLTIAIMLLVIFLLYHFAYGANMIYQENKNVGNESTLNTYEILNNLSFDNGKDGKAVNFRAVIKTVVFTGADSDIIVIHGLGRKPVGFIPVKPMNFALFKGTNETGWTANKMWMQTDYDTPPISQRFLIW